MLGEQMTRHLLGDELVSVLRALADHSQHHHVHALVRLLPHYVRTTELLYIINQIFTYDESAVHGEL